MLLGFHHYYFVCPEDGRDRAQRFYGDLLGMATLPTAPELDDGTLVWYRAGDVFLHLRFAASPEPVHPRRHIALQCDNAIALRRKLEANGVATDDAVPLPGQERFYATDPFGNRIEFVELTGTTKAT